MRGEEAEWKGAITVIRDIDHLMMIGTNHIHQTTTVILEEVPIDHQEMIGKSPVNQTTTIVRIGEVPIDQLMVNGMSRVQETTATVHIEEVPLTSQTITMDLLYILIVTKLENLLERVAVKLKLCKMKAMLGLM